MGGIPIAAAAVDAVVVVEGAVVSCAGLVKPLKLFRTGELVADGRKWSSAAAWSAALSDDELLVVVGRGGVRGECLGGVVEGAEASELRSGTRCARRIVLFQMAAAAFFFFLVFKVLLTLPMILENPWIMKNVLSTRDRFL